jgi:hypothetical protein
MVIRILEGLSNSEKKIIFSQPERFNDFISRKNFIRSQDEITAILNKAIMDNHRLPIIIQPIIQSLKDEIIKRLCMI